MGRGRRDRSEGPGHTWRNGEVVILLTEKDSKWIARSWLTLSRGAWLAVWQRLGPGTSALGPLTREQLGPSVLGKGNQLRLQNGYTSRDWGWFRVFSGLMQPCLHLRLPYLKQGKCHISRWGSMSKWRWVKSEYLKDRPTFLRNKQQNSETKE